MTITGFNLSSSDRFEEGLLQISALFAGMAERHMRHIWRMRPMQTEKTLKLLAGISATL